MNKFRRFAPTVLRLTLAACAATAVVATTTESQACYVSEDHMARLATLQFIHNIGLNEDVQSVNVSLNDAETAGVANVRLKKVNRTITLRLQKIDGSWRVIGF